MTDATPQLPEEQDKDFLDKIVHYTAEMLTRFPMTEFKRAWADRFFGTNKEIQEQAKLDWEATVALGRNKPVFLFDENGEIKWVFPPLLGEFEPRFSGDEDSLFSFAMQLKTISSRLSVQAENLSDTIYPRKLLPVQQREFWQLKLHEIRVYCGIPYPGESSEQLKTINAPSENFALKDDPDEYDY